LSVTAPTSRGAEMILIWLIRKVLKFILKR